MKKSIFLIKGLLVALLAFIFIVVNAQQNDLYNGMSKEEYKQLKLDVRNGFTEEPKMEKYNPTGNGSRQGGDDFSSAIQINELPYSDIGSTTGQGIDVSTFCETSSGSSPDVVYSFIAVTSGSLNVTTCSENSLYDTKLLVFENSESTCVGGNDDILDGSCPYNLLTPPDWSLLSEVEFQAVAGNKYYIVVTGFGIGNGQYELLVTGDAQPGCGGIGLAGEFNNWGNDGDLMMTQDPDNPYIWTATLSLTPAMNQYGDAEINEMKFRQNGNWDVNWGSSDFPVGTGIQDGANIPVYVEPEGTTIYQVTFNCSTGEYQFWQHTIPLADWAVGIGVFLIIAFTIIRLRRSIF